MNVKSDITIIASSVFVPTKTRNSDFRRSREPLFLLVGKRPKPFEQPRYRGWLRGVPPLLATAHC